MPTECSAERQHAGQRAEAHRGDEDDAHDDLGHRAQAAQQRADGLIDDRVRRWCWAAANSASGSESTTASAVPATDMASVSSSGLQPIPPAAEVGRHHLGSQLRHRRPALGEALRVEEAGQRRARRGTTSTMAPTRPASRKPARRSSARIVVIVDRCSRHPRSFAGRARGSWRLAQHVVGLVVGRRRSPRRGTI